MSRHFKRGWPSSSTTRPNTSAGWTGSSGSTRAKREAGSTTLRRISWAVTGLTLATLAAIGLFILRPAVGLIRRQVAELGQARDELEARVRERTRELELAKERHRTLIEQFSHVGRTTRDRRDGSALAHELKQPLGAIANYAEGCLVELEREQPALAEVRVALEKLLAATLRAGQIIEQDPQVRDPPGGPTRSVRRRTRSSPTCRRSSGVKPASAESRSASSLAPDLP